jgi:TIR domain
VQRERRVVAEVAKRRPIRIGHVRVDQPEFDRAGLGSFLARTRVFPSYASQDRAVVQPFLEALDAAGFQVFSAAGLAAGDWWADRIKSELEVAAREGWVLALLSASSLSSEWVMHCWFSVNGDDARPVFAFPGVWTRYKGPLKKSRRCSPS